MCYVLTACETIDSFVFKRSISRTLLIIKVINKISISLRNKNVKPSYNKVGDENIVEVDPMVSE